MEDCDEVLAYELELNEYDPCRDEKCRMFNKDYWKINRDLKYKKESCEEYAAAHFGFFSRPFEERRCKGTFEKYNLLAQRFFDRKSLKYEALGRYHACTEGVKSRNEEAAKLLT